MQPQAAACRRWGGSSGFGYMARCYEWEFQQYLELSLSLCKEYMLE